MKITDLKDYKVVSQPNVTPQTKNKEDLLTQTSNVLGKVFPGTKTVGQSIGTLGFAAKQALTGDFKGAGETVKTGPSVPQLIGGYTATGASLASTAGIGIVGGVLSKALASAGYGALMSGGSTMAEGGGVKDVAKSATIGGAVGGGVSLAFSGAGKLLKSIADKVPERLLNSATGQSKKELLAGKGISNYILDNKKIGTTQQLIEQSQQAIDEADTFINNALNSSTDKLVPVKSIADDLVQKINDAGGDMDVVKLQKILKDLAPQVEKTLGAESLTLAEANQLRSQLDKVLGSNAFINAQLPFNKGILMDFTNALRNNVKDLAPAGVRETFNTYAKEITLRNLLLSKAAGASRNQVVGLGDILFGGFGGAIGGGLPGAAAGVAMRRFSESTIAKTGGAVLINTLDKTLSPVLEQLEPAAKTAIINAIIQAISEVQNTSSQKSPQPKKGEIQK